jgi:hypothetical protein
VAFFFTALRLVAFLAVFLTAFLLAVDFRFAVFLTARFFAGAFFLAAARFFVDAFFFVDFLLVVVANCLIP